MERYIQICPAAFSYAQMTQPRTYIAPDNTVDWSDGKFEGRFETQLDYWTTPLSYSVFHELCH